MAWGYNDYGQCSIPAAAQSGVSAIAGGTFHTIALKGGAVLAWGRNDQGQCNIPASANSGVSAIAGGDYHTIALKDGAVLAWSYNNQGQCNIPASANSGVTAIAGGYLHTIALMSDCNNNGIADSIDVANGALDQNADKIPDTCQGIDQFNITTANLGVPTANTAYSHTFTNLYPTYTDATLTIRVKGDLDSANEYFTLKLNDVTYTRIFDNTNSTGINCTNATNGGVSTVALTIPKATFAQYATAGQLKVTLLASPYVTAGECADGSTTVQLQFQGLTPGADCNSDTVWDLAEIYSNAALDRDLNRQLDACQIRDNPLLDRNNNGELDTYDISVNSALDCDGNKFIDTYEILDTPGLDCDSNGTLDFCDTANTGSVAGWGNNGSGQITIPTNLGTCKQIAAFLDHSLGIQNDGTVKAWGMNNYGQCNVPSDLGTCKQVAAGNYHSAAIKMNGTVRAWGCNNDGQCNIPSDLGTCTKITAGGADWYYYPPNWGYGMSPRGHTVAIQTSGKVRAWGFNDYGQCNVPIDLGACTQIAAGPWHSVAIQNSGTVRAWGWNASGCCDVPADLGACTQVVAGPDLTVALQASGTVRAWGYNGNGQCNVPSDLGACTQIAASGWAWSSYYYGQRDLGGFTVALQANGTARAWGYNGQGQCNIPSNLGAASKIAAGRYHTLALRENIDFNGNHRQDTCDILDNPLLDRNNNSVLDVYDIFLNPSLDCDGNMFIDQYEIVDNAALDCNRNGRIDTCDLAEGVTDCNQNRIIDFCDIETDPSLDCDFNGKIDTCDVGAGAIDDDGDGRPDACEIAKGDLDLSGIVDSGDFSILLLYYGEENTTFGDFDGSGIIDTGDASIMLLYFGEVTWP